MAVVEIDGLSKMYRRGFWGVKVPALQDLHLKVEEGEIFGFLGPNGAGKTTTLKILLRIIYPTSGNAKVLGNPIGSAVLKTQVGYMPENPYFYRFLTPVEFLRFYARLSEVSRQGLKKKIDDLIELVGLAHARNQRIGEFSKGMTQRIGLAQALLHEPKIIFMDEPLSGLDPIGRSEMRRLILSLRKQGKTVFFCSHILSDVESICERVAILHRGKLIRQGAISELLEARVKAVEVRIRAGEESRIKEWQDKAVRFRDRGEGLYDLSFENEEAAGDFVQNLPGMGSRLVSMQPEKETLEEYFMHLIGQEGGISAQ